MGMLHLIQEVRGYCVERHLDSVWQLLSTRNHWFVTTKLMRAIMFAFKSECRNAKNLSKEKAPG